MSAPEVESAELQRLRQELVRAREEASAAIERVRRLEAITLAGLTEPDLESSLAALLEITHDVLGCEAASILLRDERTRRLVVAATIGREPEIASRMRVPLELDGVLIGAIEVTATPMRPIADADRILLDRVAERAALTIGHAQLRERERAVAETLQRSLLQETLPDVPGLGVCARYLPRLDGVGVGGDFYDAFALEDGRVALSIGDVAGKGLRAASTMGRICHAMRAYAMEATGPGETLERLDRLVVEEGDEMATATHLLLDPRTGSFTYANAGHPPALRVSAQGETSWLGEALAPPLGAGVAPRAEVSGRLDPGDRLLFYTDGLIERRGESLDAGLEDLERRAAFSGSLEDLCETTVDDIATTVGSFEDDVAVLAVELHG